MGLNTKNEVCIKPPALDHGMVFYRTDKLPVGWKWNGKWNPSIHMPKRFARIWLQVEDVRVERVQEITGYGAREEGVELDETRRHWYSCVPSYKESFQTLWDSIYAARGFGWERNPWVWVVTFCVVSMTGREGMLS
jgi:hypothetical protein